MFSVDRMGNNSADAPSSSQQAAAAAAAGVQLLDGLGCVVAALPGGGCFAAIPLTDCPHLCRVEPPPAVAGVDVRRPCVTCADETENWLCLTCYAVFCSRYVNGHGMAHFKSHSHPMALSFSDLSAWCYECEAYVHNEVLEPAKRAAYASKFGRPAPTAASRADLHPADETQGWQD